VNLLETGQRGGGLRLRVAGTPVLLEWTFLVWTVLIGATLGDPALAVAWLVIVTVSILVHELGHAVALRGWGVPSRIVLHVMGGVTTHEAALPTRWSRIAVSLAGPAAGMLLLGLPAVLVDAAWPAPDPWDDVLHLVLWVNLGWAVVNLLPVLPLDGGHVAHELLDAGTRGRGELPARWLSVLIAGAAGAWALANGFMFGAVFAGFFVIDNLQAIRGRRERAASADLRPAAAALEAGSTVTTLSLARGVVDSARDSRARAMGLELMAWAHLADGDPAAATVVLADYPPDVTPSGHLRALLTEPDPAERVNATVDAWLIHRYVPPGIYAARLAEAGLVDVVAERLLGSRADGAPAARLAFQHALFAGGQFEASARVGQQIIAAGEANPTVAYNVACAHARSGHRDAALTWLEKTVALGFRDTALLEGDPDLAGVRTDPRFALVRNRIPA
jgi:Zn-dependent protease